MTKKRRKFGTLPIINMPQKSHHTKKPPPRTARSVVKDLPLQPANKWCYSSFSELCKRVHGLKSITEWHLQELKDSKGRENHSLPPTLQWMMKDFFGWKQPSLVISTNGRKAHKTALVNSLKMLEVKCSSPGRLMRGSRLQPIQ